MITLRKERGNDPTSPLHRNSAFAPRKGDRRRLRPPKSDGEGDANNHLLAQHERGGQ